MLTTILVVIVIFVLLACLAGSPDQGDFIKVDKATQKRLREDPNLRIFYEQERKVDEEARAHLPHDKYLEWRAQKHKIAALSWQAYYDDGRGNW